MNFIENLSVLNSVVGGGIGHVCARSALYWVGCREEKRQVRTCLQCETKLRSRRTPLGWKRNVLTRLSLGLRHAQFLIVWRDHPPLYNNRNNTLVLFRTVPRELNSLGFSMKFISGRRVFHSALKLKG